MATSRYSLTGTISAIAVGISSLAEAFRFSSEKVSNFHESATTKPEQITYGPQRKGKGGKVKKW